MLTYDIEIQDLSTGEVKRMDSCVGWNQHSETIWRTRFCDCNLAGYFFRQNLSTKAGSVWEPHNFVAYDWRKRNGGGCDHVVPPRKFAALRAHLADGRIIELQ